MTLDMLLPFIVPAVLITVLIVSAVKRDRAHPPDRAEINRRNKLAAGCVLAFFVLPMSFLWMLTVLNFGLLGIWLGTLLVFFLIAPLIKELPHIAAQKIGSGLKIAALAVFVLLNLSPLVYFKFQKTDALYPVRRALWGYGGTSDTLLPDTLPPHSDYAFIMESKLHGPDGHPCAYLVLRTDAETIAAYEQKFAFIMNRTENIPYTAEELEERQKSYTGSQAYMANKPQAVPTFVWHRMTQAGVTEPLAHCSVYTYGNAGQWYMGSGAVIDRESNLLVIWI